MKSFTVCAFALFAVLAVSCANANSQDEAAQVLRYENDNIGVDGFKYSYETSNGVSAQEEGTLQNAGSENEAIVVKGSFQYTAPDGQVISVNYIADENGFQPEGAHIPQVQ